MVVFLYGAKLSSIFGKFLKFSGILKRLKMPPCQHGQKHLAGCAGRIGLD
jgi:hypothetical protein